MNGKTVMALLAGLAAGAAIGILLAPDKGSETRKKLGNSVKDLGGQGSDLFNNIVEKMGVGGNHNGNGQSKQSATNA